LDKTLDGGERKTSFPEVAQTFFSSLSGRGVLNIAKGPKARSKGGKGGISTLGAKEGRPRPMGRREIRGKQPGGGFALRQKGV